MAARRGGSATAVGSSWARRRWAVDSAMNKMPHMIAEPILGYPWPESCAGLNTGAGTHRRRIPLFHGDEPHPLGYPIE